MEIDAAVLCAMGSGRYILGEEVKAFEKEFSDYLEVPYGFGVGSGTEALHLALAACKIGPGDEVITTAHTAVATVSAIELTGATTVFCDIEPDYFALDPEKLEAKITSRTKAVIPVHIYGQSSALSSIQAISKNHGLWLIEDCAQAHGAKFHGKRVGAVGDISCFSFYPTKNLGAIGDGGFVATTNVELAERVKLLREYGWKERYVSHINGWNSRLDELQAAILRIKLRYLDNDNRRRRAIAAQYNQAFEELALILPPERPEAEHVYHLYVLRAKHRDQLIEHLAQHGIGALIHYPVPVHLQPAYTGRLGLPGDLPVTEHAAKEILSLPIYPELTADEVGQVIATVRNWKNPLI